MKGGAKALEISRQLAVELGQLPESFAPGSVAKVHSRSKAGEVYEVTIGLDGVLQCTCPASFHRLECWHVKYVREELAMTTETSTALVPVVVKPPTTILPSAREINTVQQAALMAFNGAVSLPQELNTPDKVAAVMLYGFELGVRPMTALQHLYIVKGKVTASAQLMAGMCMNAERDIAFHVKHLDAQSCSIRFVRPSRGVDHTMTVTWEQIIKSGNAGGANANYPEDRLRYHCVKRLCRTFAPDLINNLADGVAVAGLTAEPEGNFRITEEDLYNEGDTPANVDRETGEILEGEYSTVQEPHQQAPAPAPPSAPAAKAQATPRATAAQRARPVNPAGADAMNGFWLRVRSAGYKTTDVMDKSTEWYGKSPVEMDDAGRDALFARFAAGDVLPPAEEQGVEHEPDATYTEGGELVCSVCSLGIDEATGQHLAPQPMQAGLPA